MTDRDTPLVAADLTVHRDAFAPAIICAAIAFAIVIALFAILAAK